MSTPAPCSAAVRPTGARPHRFYFALSRDEHAQLRSVAASCGMTMAAWLRETIVRAQVAPPLPAQPVLPLDVPRQRALPVPPLMAP